MILATHVVAATAVSIPFLKSPLLCFFIGFISHFLLDAIPHWDWKLRSLEENQENLMNNSMTRNYKPILKDIFGVSVDIFIGIVLVLMVSSLNDGFNEILAVSTAVFGGILPDGLQIVYFFYKKEPLISLQKFHFWIHTNLRISHEKVLKGIIYQVPIIITSLIIIKLFE